MFYLATHKFAVFVIRFGHLCFLSEYGDVGIKRCSIKSPLDPISNISENFHIRKLLHFSGLNFDKILPYLGNNNLISQPI